jgi:hypothetical protein
VLWLRFSAGEGRSLLHNYSTSWKGRELECQAKQVDEEDDDEDDDGGGRRGGG